MDRLKSARELQKELTEFAVDIGNKFGYNLDYSNKSVQDVEKILAILSKEYLSSGNTEGLYGIALEFALYIVTVIERNFGKGTLNRNHDEFGEDTFPFEWRGKTLFPYSWCQKRIFDGDSDSVWSKYEIIVLKKDEKKTLIKKIKGFLSKRLEWHKDIKVFL